MRRQFRWRARTASRSSCSRSLRTAVLLRSSAAAGDIPSSANQLSIDTESQTMPEDALLKDLRRRMDGALEVLRKEFGGLRTGRASASLLEPIMVNAYGNTVPLNQVAGINVPEPRLITVQVWDRGVVKAVDKAIRESGLDLNPQTEGQTIRVPIPDLNEERRRNLTRVAAKYAEDTKVSVRNVRRDGIEVLKRREKDAEISQDEHRKLQREVQHLTDDYVKRIDDALAQKDQEILQV